MPKKAARKKEPDGPKAFVVRLERAIYKRLKLLAVKEETSMNKLIEEAVRKLLQDRK